MEGRITYAAKEVEKIISVHIEQILPAPKGFFWASTSRTYNGVDCDLVEIVKEKKE